MNTNVLTPTEDIAQFIESLVEVEGHTREAAVAGAQKYALEYSYDLRERSGKYSDEGLHIIAENLLSLSYEYRKLAQTLK